MEMSEGLQVVRLLKKVMDFIKCNVQKEFIGMDITASQGIILRILGHEGKMKISDLSKKLGLSPSTVSGIIDRMEKQSLVERIRSNEDRRVVFVDITKETRNHFKKIFLEPEITLENIMNRATKEEMEKILVGLNTLHQLLERQNNSQREEHK